MLTDRNDSVSMIRFTAFLLFVLTLFDCVNFLRSSIKERSRSSSSPFPISSNFGAFPLPRSFRAVCRRVFVFSEAVHVGRNLRLGLEKRVRWGERNISRVICLFVQFSLCLVFHFLSLSLLWFPFCYSWFSYLIQFLLLYVYECRFLFIFIHFCV